MPAARRASHRFKWCYRFACRGATIARRLETPESVAATVTKPAKRLVWSGTLVLHRGNRRMINRHGAGRLQTALSATRPIVTVNKRHNQRPNRRQTEQTARPCYAAPWPI
jgi:hypothetical protein